MTLSAMTVQRLSRCVWNGTGWPRACSAIRQYESNPLSLALETEGRLGAETNGFGSARNPRVPGADDRVRQAAQPRKSAETSQACAARMSRNYKLDRRALEAVRRPQCTQHDARDRAHCCPARQLRRGIQEVRATMATARSDQRPGARPAQLGAEAAVVASDGIPGPLRSADRDAQLSDVGDHRRGAS